MPALLLALFGFVTPVVSKFFDVSKDTFLLIVNFFKNNTKLFIKWGIFLVIINLSFSLLSFLLYTFYYGGAYVLSHFVTQTTLNIMHMSTVAMIFYFIYKFLYKSN